MTRRCTACNAVTANAKFCSRSCAASHNNTLAPKRKRAQQTARCLYCAAELLRHTAKYCGTSCAAALKREAWVAKWLQNEFNASAVDGEPRMRVMVRTLLVQHRGANCELCGWGEVNPTSGRVYLEVDHIDGDRRNNFISNLRLLCPNCHSLTPTFRHLNRGQRNVG